MNCGYGCWLDKNSPMTLFITSCGGKKSSRNCGRIRATTRASKGNPFLILKIIKNKIFYDWIPMPILFFPNLIVNGKNILLSSLNRQLFNTDETKSSRITDYPKRSIKAVRSCYRCVFTPHLPCSFLNSHIFWRSGITSEMRLTNRNAEKTKQEQKRTGTSLLLVIRARTIYKQNTNFHLLHLCIFYSRTEWPTYQTRNASCVAVQRGEKMLQPTDNFV